MYERKTDRDIRCPLECGFEVFSGKWKIRIIGILGGKGTLRNSGDDRLSLYRRRFAYRTNIFHSS